ncbi:RNase P subunit RPR2 [Beijerinckia sp. GAS462]|nr:RNase P subunit RPR2 [Beijerinckia sp. GAS462]
MRRLAAHAPPSTGINAVIDCDSCGWKNLLPADPSHMIIMGRPWRIKLMCSHCGVTHSYALDRIALPCASQPHVKAKAI